MTIPKYINEIGKKLRKSQTDAEKILWGYLRMNKCIGKRFLRQKPIKVFREDSWIDRYIIADFVCYENKLIIELDGSIHYEQEIIILDREKGILLENLGYKIIRFKNEEVFDDIRTVLEKIEASLLS